MSKIQIESNSQHALYDEILQKKLYLSCQRYKSKAIHNPVQLSSLINLAVFIMSKIQIESNSQQAFCFLRFRCSCIYHVKDTNRKQFTTWFWFLHNSLKLYLSCQRYKSKAIHNDLRDGRINAYAVFIMSKIQIESNSQLIAIVRVEIVSCIYHVKDTNRKQFTTTCRWCWFRCKLYLSCQRYKSKAIHNISVVTCKVKKGFNTEYIVPYFYYFWDK